MMQLNEKYLLDTILETISASDNATQSLDRIVHIIATQLHIDVCSVYVYNPYDNSLSLKATCGLNREAVGKIEMDLSEGLTGLVIETMAPVFVVNPGDHPRYKYYAGSGEEKYKTYLGVPLIYHKKVIGALVVQTVAEADMNSNAVEVFRRIAGQIAPTLAFLMLQEDRPSRELPEPVSREKSNTDADESITRADNHLRGEPVSDRAASGFVHYLADTMGFEQIQRKAVSGSACETEIHRLEQAFSAAAARIREVSDQARGISDQDRAIIEAHLMLLADRSLKRRIVDKINSGMNAEYALKQVIFDYADMFRAMEDAYLSERAADILDIGRRVLENLVGNHAARDQAFERDTILVAADISPVDLLAIRQPRLNGIVLAKGGRTSHTVIMARSLEIPVVIGVEGLAGQVRSGDFLIVDGVSGLVYVNPTQQIRDAYDRRRAETAKVQKKLEALRDLPAITTDGFGVHMGANIGLLSDIMLARKYGADHIGLYRTEFPFLLRNSFPSEDEQVSLYARVLEKADGRAVTIRTFDVGGDKFLSYLDAPKEDNPFLGWRSIRLSLDLEDVFRTQIRAILRASALGKIRMLFPMISSVEEIRQVEQLVEAEKQYLDRHQIAYDRDIEMGIMVEVPAAVPILDRLLRYADFVNIGTNDLMQYLLAVDRNNKKVARYFNSLHPSVITTVHQIVSVCRHAEKQVCICGEAAAVNESIFLFVAMGADYLSMVPASIPAAKQFIRAIRKKDAENALAACMVMEDAREIAAYLKNMLPGVAAGFHLQR